MTNRFIEQLQQPAANRPVQVRVHFHSTPDPDLPPPPSPPPDDVPSPDQAPVQEPTPPAAPIKA